MQQQQQQQQQPHAAVVSPFRAVQQLDNGALHAFAEQLLHALEQCQVKPHPAPKRRASGSGATDPQDTTQRSSSHHRAPKQALPQAGTAPGQPLHQHGPAAAGTAQDDTATAAAGVPQHDSDCDADVEDYSEDDSESDSEADTGHAEVRALLESCLTEAAERARSEAALSGSRLYSINTESSLGSSSSVNAAVTSSGAVLIDWDAMLRTELQGSSWQDEEQEQGSDSSEQQDTISEDEVQSAAVNHQEAAV